MVKELVISDRSRGQDSYATVRALIDFMQYVLVDSLANLVRDEALPLKEPI